MSIGYAVIIPHFVVKIILSESSIYATELIAINQIFKIICKKFYERNVLFAGSKVQ